MMNIKDVLSPGECSQQHRFVPGGKETSPSQIFVTTERVIIETSKWLGLKKEYQDLHYSDIMNVILKKACFKNIPVPTANYFGDDFLLRRHDYHVDVAGSFPVAQYVYDIVDVDGLRFPTKRRAYLRGPHLKPIRDLLLVSITFDANKFRLST